MTEDRKRPPVPSETWIEQVIRAAEKRGEFENLPGAGKPIPGLDRPHDDLWWVKQLLRREKLEVVPPGLALRREVEAFVERIRSASSEETVRRLVAELNAKIAGANARAADGPPSTIGQIDPDEAVARWRDRYRKKP